MLRLSLLFTLIFLGVGVLEAQRPQDPERPYPYLEERLFFDNPRAAGVRLAATLTLPEVGGPFPAVVLVSGSGDQDRDYSVAGHKPFLVIADYLTQRGFAVLRYDDRGAFQSTGDFDAATTEDLASDARAAVEYLEHRSEIDPAQIGIVGHSEGGLIAPIVAAQSPAVAFIVLLAGLGVSGEEINHLQQALFLASLGANEASIAYDRIRNERYYAVIKEEPDDRLAAPRLLQVWNDGMDGKFLPEGFSDEELEPILSELATLTDENKAQLTRTAFEPLLKRLLSPWFRFLLTYDPRLILRQVEVPVLAMNGEKDVLVPAQENLAEIEVALIEGDNSDFSIVQLADLNHFFQTAETGARNEYASIEETFAPVALKVLGDWLVDQTSIATAVVEIRDGEVPSDFGLAQNYPNPFNGKTLIPFTLLQAGPVELSLHNGLGQKVVTLASGVRSAGRYTLHWDGQDAHGRSLASGLYFYKLITPQWTQTRQLLLLQ
jgi:uncharacterized protein